MTENRAVWGIDIGQGGLKAIRLRYAEAAKQVIAVAFDYVPHPKILSQPDANPEELIKQALETFLSRNQTKGDVIAISVPGQTALARFIQLPPVEMSKVVEIVKYEAKQQIPFALEEVIWDFQPLGAGAEESGFLLDAEVGLFAMKREQVQHHLSPYLRQKMEVELIQIAPLALYNYLCHDQFAMTPGSEVTEQEDYTIVLDMGADNTTLLVSNGKKIWNRNVPIGGNHFTRALTKEMKLTFAKAEHLKCNATKSPDPKAIFQALRPVFNDYVSEIQRSIGYFSSVNRNAKIKRILGVGNGFKLAGLQKFLHQNLQMEVERVEAFNGIVGDTVLSAPLFLENMLSFAVPYGLALQGLKITRVYTSLLPPEIKTARIIRRKKPWAVAAAAVLLFGLATSTVGYSHVWNSVGTKKWGEAESTAKKVTDGAGAMKSAYDAAVAKNKELRTEGDLLVGDAGGRTYWLELYKAINETLPRDLGDDQDETDPSKKNRIRVYSITAEHHPDLSAWFTKLDARSKQNMLPADVAAPPTGAGYVFTLLGRHFHDDPDVDKREDLYVVNTMLRNLQGWRVNHKNPPETRGANAPLNGPNKPLQIVDPDTFNPLKFPDAASDVPVRQLGITHATLPASISNKVMFIPKHQRNLQQLGQGNPGVPGFSGPPKGPMGLGPMGPMGPMGLGVPAGPGKKPPTAEKGSKKKALPGVAVPVAGEDGSVQIPQTDFKVQFVWKETPVKDRKPIEPPPAPAADGTQPATATPADGTAPATPPAAVSPMPMPMPGGPPAGHR